MLCKTEFIVLKTSTFTTICKPHDAVKNMWHLHRELVVITILDTCFFFELIEPCSLTKIYLMKLLVVHYVFFSVVYSVVFVIYLFWITSQATGFASHIVQINFFT